MNKTSNGSLSAAENAKIRADKCVKSEDFENALREYNNAINSSKNEVAEYFLARANTLEKLGKLDEALFDLRRAIYIRKKAIQFGELADAYLELGDHLKAEKYFLKAIGFDSSNEKYRKGLEVAQGSLK